MHHLSLGVWEPYNVAPTNHVAEDRVATAFRDRELAYAFAFTLGSHFQKGLLRRDADTNTPEACVTRNYSRLARILGQQFLDALPSFG